jgi:alpha-tubulin suppressor-like RCC1 family protein
VQQAYQVIAVSAGHAHSVALTNDGVVLTWGNGGGGRLGLGDEDDRSLPSMVGGMPPVSIISAGFDFTVACCRSNKAVDEGTKAEPEVYVWGCGKDGRLGMGTEDTYLSPVPLLPALGVGMQGVATVTSGKVYIYGLNTMIFVALPHSADRLSLTCHCMALPRLRLEAQRLTG